MKQKNIHKKVNRKAQAHGLQGDLSCLPSLLSIHHLNNLDIIITKWSGAQQTICGIAA